MKYNYKIKTFKSLLYLGFLMFSSQLSAKENALRTLNHERFSSFNEHQINATTISGTVTSQSGEALPGVSVSQKNSKNFVQTDLNGKYQITLLDGPKTLVFTYVGFKTLEKEISNNATSLNVTLEDDFQSINEVIVTGYTVEKKRDVLGSIGSIKAEQIDQTTPVNALDAIQGRMAGVSISTNNGPGGGADIKIRGTSTLSGGVDPLYVVDGQQLEDINNLNPNDIASIEVLKDGASAAIYGSKSANGVVIITTKKGAIGQTKVDANYVRTYSNLFAAIPVANSRQRFDAEKLKDGGTAGGIVDSLGLQTQQNPDLQDLISRTAVKDQLNISFSGASEKNNYYANIGYLNEDGVVVNSSYERINTNLNLNFDINKSIKSGFRINGSYERTNGLNENTVFNQLVERPAWLPVRDYNGALFPEVFGRQNPLAEALESTRDNKDFRSQIFNFIELKIFKDLRFKSTVGGNFRLSKINEFSPTIVQRIDRDADGLERQILTYDFQHEDYFTYNKKIKKHNIVGLAGFQIQKWNRDFSNLQGTFVSDNIPTFNNVKVFDLGRFTTLKSQHSLLSFYGKATYDYSGKYLFAATIRRDASSRFGSGKKSGTFPSISAGWRVSDENFMKSINKVVSDMKLRVAYGVNGNERIGDYDALALYAPGNFYDGVNGVGPIQLENPNLAWENTKSVNYGLDLSFLNGRITTSVDAYVKTTDDLLYNVPVPQETGFTTIRQNVGSIQNKGLEFFISATPLRLKNFAWTSSFNIAFNANEVLSLANPAGFEQGIFNIQVGEPVGNMYGFTQLGVFAFDQSNAFTDAGIQLTPQISGGNFTGYTLNGQPYTGTVRQLKVGSDVLKGGDVYWKDLNGDFNIDGQNDRSVIGNGYAKSFGGFFNEFKYKAFGLSFLFDFNFGNDIYKQYDQNRNYSTSFGATPAPDAIDLSWRKQGDVTDFPNLDRNRSQNRLGVSSRFVSKADYIKFRNVRFNYILPNSIAQKVSWLSGVSFNFSINNPIVWTNYDGFNPELGTRGVALEPGVDNLRYPNKIEYVLGLRAQF